MKRAFTRYHLPPILWALLIFAGSSFSGSSVPRSFLYMFPDKLLHALQYAVFGFLITRSIRHVRLPAMKRHAILVSVSVAALYALSDEFHQSFVPQRSVELGDIIADAVGALLGAAAYFAYKWQSCLRLQRLKNPIR